MFYNQVKNLVKKLNKEEKVFVLLDHPTSKYNGSVVYCHLEPDGVAGPWEDPIYFQLSAPGLKRRLNFHYLSLQMTDATSIKLVVSPTIKKKIILRDFSKRIIEKRDVLFNDGNLIRIEKIRPSGICDSICIASNKSSNIGKRNIHRSLKKYIWIEDPTLIILNI